MFASRNSVAARVPRLSKMLPQLKALFDWAYAHRPKAATALQGAA
ncbi:MAG: hypothetical protein ABIO17_11390 [Pseudoxanthomonas sp.]